MVDLNPECSSNSLGLETGSLDEAKFEYFECKDGVNRTELQLATVNLPRMQVCIQNRTDEDVQGPEDVWMPEAVGMWPGFQAPHGTHQIRLPLSWRSLFSFFPQA